MKTQHGAQGRLERIDQQHQLKGPRGGPRLLAASEPQPVERVQGDRELHGDLDGEEDAHVVRLLVVLHDGVVVLGDVEVPQLLEGVQGRAGVFVEPCWVERHGVEAFSWGEGGGLVIQLGKRKRTKTMGGYAQDEGESVHEDKGRMRLRASGEDLQPMANNCRMNQPSHTLSRQFLGEGSMMDVFK